MAAARRDEDDRSEGNELRPIWDKLNEHHGDLASVKTDLSGLRREVGSVNNKMDNLLEAVTHLTAARGPGLMDIMKGLGLLLAIVGGLCTGIAIFVGNLYGGQLAGLERDLRVAEIRISVWQAERDAELVRLREARLKTLEEQRAWEPTIR